MRDPVSNLLNVERNKMNLRVSAVLSIILLFLLTTSVWAVICQERTSMYRNEPKVQKDARMQWWREARFGMFIHWGLYAIPAGQWNDKTDYAEWIMMQAQIPVDEYEKFCQKFVPVKFDASEWVRIAKDAGMKYLVITTKHHDGFCLWNSIVSDYDVVDRTPFKRDILKELAEACKKNGIRLCFYYSIMDWHHPDYLPRREWESRSSERADYQNYISYMKTQLKELITLYDPGVIWFDGEWESTWTYEEGLKLYDYVRSLKPDIIINNRVDKLRKGMQGFSQGKNSVGDFHTPEQQIPHAGLPGVDWESCITMNKHWGWNKRDKNFKSAKQLIRQLVDITSKGGNYLLNIGPKDDGTFPQESIDNLRRIGQWMDINGESIYGTTASPFAELSWGRCTKKIVDEKNILYLHVFDWPADGNLRIPELKNGNCKASLLANHKALKITVGNDGAIIEVPKTPPDLIDTVIILEIKNHYR